MSLAPRNAKEFARVLQTDPAVSTKLHNLVADADTMIVKGVSAIILEFMRKNDVDPRLMKGNIGDALKLYYKQIHLTGDFVKMH